MMVRLDAKSLGRFTTLLTHCYLTPESGLQKKFKSLYGAISILQDFYPLACL